MAIRLLKGTPSSLDPGNRFHLNAILSGTFLILGFATFFVLLGNAIGLNPANAVMPDVSGVLKFWSWVYVAATAAFSYFVGSFLCTRPNDITTPGSAMLHALIAWALATVLAVAVGCVASPSFRHTIAGIGPNSANWLALSTIVVGGALSALGGLFRKGAVSYTTAVTDRDHKAA